MKIFTDENSRNHYDIHQLFITITSSIITTTTMLIDHVNDVLIHRQQRFYHCFSSH